MKNRIFFLACISALAVGCQPTPTPPPGPCDGKNVCFEFNGSQIGLNATWSDVHPNQHRIYWSETTASQFTDLTIDLYGTLTPSTFAMMNFPNDSINDVVWDYFQNGTETGLYLSDSGQVVITSTANNTISGTFNGWNNYLYNRPITNGTLTNIPHQ